MKLAARLAVISLYTSVCFTAGIGISYANSQWSANHCNSNASSGWPDLTRGASRNYAATANGDGYSWGGGCWNQNGVDDTPNDNNGDPDDIGGEGPDCSGLTFKSWGLAKDWTTSKRFWGAMTYEHGPYTAAAFKAGNGASQVVSNKANLTTMDGLASSSHIGLIYTVGASGSDTIVEAKGDAYGSGIWTRNYREQTTYTGTRRQLWVS